MAFLGRTPYVLIGRPDLPATSLASLTTLVRESAARPLSHGHIGYGSMIHLLGERITASAPNHRLPKLPALSQLDPALADFVYETWGAVFVPRSACTRHWPKRWPTRNFLPA